MSLINKSSDEIDHLHVGIDAGSVSLNCIVINENREIVYEFPYTRHLGRIEEKVLTLIRHIYEKFGEENIFLLQRSSMNLKLYDIDLIGMSLENFKALIKETPEEYDPETRLISFLECTPRELSKKLNNLKKQMIKERQYRWMQMRTNSSLPESFLNHYKTKREIKSDQQVSMNLRRIGFQIIQRKIYY